MVRTLPPPHKLYLYVAVCCFTVRRMALFERHGVTLSREQLLSEVQSHYVSQAIDQAYVLLFGLEVLGNPYGLIKDFTQGLGDFFYEPFMVSQAEP